MKKGQIRTGVVRNVKFPNRAMVVLEPLEGAADDEEICEVKGALPGQKISVQRRETHMETIWCYATTSVKGNSGKITCRNCRC